MIHLYDSHFWLAKLPDGSWISAEDHASWEQIFQTAKRIRIEPLSLQSIQAVLDCKVLPGYTAFLRTDIHRDMATNRIARLGYVLALERGSWADPGGLAIGGFRIDETCRAVAWDGLPILDGFRAELCCWNGVVLFDSSNNFEYSITKDGIIDVYKFEKSA